jgi:hypothetical protein
MAKKQRKPEMPLGKSRQTQRNALDKLDADVANPDELPQVEVSI